MLRGELVGFSSKCIAVGRRRKEQFDPAPDVAVVFRVLLSTLCVQYATGS